MRTKRFMLTLAVLCLTLLAFAAGVNAALDRLSELPTQSSIVVYDEQGHALFAYNGDLHSVNLNVRPASNFAVPSFLHRT